jgi:RNA polymerase sigma-70 factor (ECF subfamily)
MIRLFKKPYQRLTDEELMIRVARSREENAFNELYRRYARRLQGFFFRMYDYNQDAASDACQELFLKIWTFGNSYKEDAPFKPWLYTIAYNQYKSACRHMEVETTYANEQAALSEESADNDYDIKLDNETMLEALYSILKELPKDYRTLFALRYEEELSIAQVAQILKVPEGTVKSRVHRLLQSIKQQLKDYE